MKSIKKYIKNGLPPSFLDAYQAVKLLPRYIQAVRKDYTVGMEKLAFYSDNETIDQIINNRMSLARFGDGEFQCIMEDSEIFFQKCSSELALELKKALQNKNPSLLTGIPIGMFCSDGCKLHVKMWWKIVKWETFSQIVPLLDHKKTYCNASITRPYIDYINNDYSRKCFENVRRLWNGRDCIFVEGNSTKLGVGNDLFDNAKTIVRILCPAENAFEKLEEIKDAIRKYANKESLILGALGPAATVLASQMCDEGYQFVDIGHIDVEYIWFLRGAKKREPIEGKYVNECSRIVMPFDHSDEKYSSSVLTTIQ